MTWDKRPASWPLVVILAIAVGAGATGCSVTKSSFRCENANCEIKLSGEGADAELDSLDLTIVLTGTEGETATLDVLREAGGPDETVQLAEGESAEALGTKVTLERVEGAEVTVRTGPGSTE